MEEREWYTCQQCGDVKKVTSVESYTEPCPNCGYKFRKRITSKHTITFLESTS